MSRDAAIAHARRHLDSGGLVAELTRRIAVPSTSQEPERAAALRSYLDEEMAPSLARLGFAPRVLDNPLGPPFLVAERIEDPALLTVLIYGHGDTVRGLDDLWRPGLSPWTLTVEGDRIYGRGTNFVIADQSSNGTFLAIDGNTREVALRRDEAMLGERGAIGLGGPTRDGGDHVVRYELERRKT